MTAYSEAIDAAAVASSGRWIDTAALAAGGRWIDATAVTTDRRTIGAARAAGAVGVAGTACTEGAAVVVVGAGPAGASAAFHLASRGRRVLLLDRATFPRDKSCGDAVTRAGVALLAEMGVLAALPSAWRVDGLRVTMRGHRPRDFPDENDRRGLVVPRIELDQALVRAATRAGATLRQGARVRRLTHRDGRVAGVELADGEVVPAAAVVAADGAASALSRQAGLTATPAGGMGHALRAYVGGVTGLDGMLEFAVPISDSSSRRWLASYGWVFPLAPGLANVGVGVVERVPGVRADRMLAEFVAGLRAGDPRFAHARVLGRARGAPLRFDFSPERCWAPGLALVGDAAGMISPFTGEGISFALESGKLAAEAIDERLAAGRPDDLSGYARELGRRFQGYFETGRHAARRHRLVWHVLDDTFDSERPIFALTRRVALAPEGMAGFGSAGIVTDVRACLEPELGAVADLVAVGETLAATVRGEWPFLTRLHALTGTDTTTALRPALLVLLCARFGERRPPDLVSRAAAIELAGLAALAQSSIPDDRPRTEPDGHPRHGMSDGMSDAMTGGQARGRVPNWGTMFAVLSADVLLARALDLCVSGRGELARIVEEAAAGRMRELVAARAPTPPTPAERLALASRIGPAALFAAACELGARPSGAPPEVVRALTEYGRALGSAMQLADDLARLLGGTDRLGRDVRADLEEPLPSVPLLLLGDRSGAAGPDLVRRARASDVEARTTALITGLLDQARACLTGLPTGAPRRALAALLDLCDRSPRRSDGAAGDEALEDARLPVTGATWSPGRG
ncbi:geranylgeranyl reductase family protein [Nonomuraea sp. NPDC050643]|uniref:geranylgeranyl reductase family protein n=1 Tax=Nonomuraea sp. NPDC050643 TaxID=3155660 RepID=UPI00340E86A0